MKQVFFLFVFFALAGVSANAQGAVSFDVKSVGSFQDATGSPMSITDNSLTVEGTVITGMKRTGADDLTAIWTSARSKNVKVKLHFRRDPTGQVTAVDVIDVATSKTISTFTRKGGAPKK